ncbi:MAG: sigma-70 family RNA polymerase sigma factor, partial [Clostridia bacterium]|nr:sigma-70 family RNA polymerase sigma factor [Clostridia bacterium]
FEGNDKFVPWVKQIATNTARDWIKKKKPTLFTEMSKDDEQDTPIEEQFADGRSTYIPEQVIDANETKRLIREIIDELPEDQRVVIGMYYYEELSVREIARALGATESAVKSRLMYGRKKIEKKVRELEKRGTKLYGLAPIPFLMLLFRNQDASAAELPNGQVLQKVLKKTPNIGKAASTSGGASAGTAAGTAASVAGGFGLTKLILITVITAIVGGAIIGGIFGVTQLVSNNSNNQQTNTAVDTASETTEPKATSSPVDDAMEKYRAVIANAASYQYDPYGVTPSGNYRYALVMMNIEDTVPTLLLEQQDTEGMYYMRAFKYDTENKIMHQPTDSLMEGVAWRGGYRGGINLAADGNGLLMTEISSGTGSTSIHRANIEGDTLIQDMEWSGRMDAIPGNLQTINIEWHDIGDLSALDGWTPTGTGAANTQTAAQPTQPTPLPTDGNRTVLTGTVGTYTYDEVLALQGISDPNPGYSSTKNKPIRLIVLDSPQTITANNADGELRSGTANIIDVSYADNIEQYSGQHITFSIDPHMTGWPSDASLPLGEPSTRDIHILN